MKNTNETFPACETCGADAGEICGKGCPSEATRGTNESPSSLAKAVESLGAVEVAPGYYAVKTGRVYAVATTEWLSTLDDATTPLPAFPVLMPPWWSPSQRYRHVDAIDRPAEDWKNGVALGYYVTADLETGAEVPA